MEEEGFTPFWAVTRYEDVFSVSRNNEKFLNTRNSVLGPDAQLEFLNTLGIEPKTLIGTSAKLRSSPEDVRTASRSETSSRSI